MREENPQTPSADDDSDVTLVTPLFDDVAAVSAQPVVPLAASPQPSAASRRTAATAPGYSFVPVRRSAIISLVLISSIIGGVVGGLALRFYQKRQSASAASAPPVTKQASAPVVESPAPQQAEPTTQQTEPATQQAATNEEARQQTVAAQIPSEEAPNTLEERVETSQPPPAAPTHEASKEERSVEKTSEPRRASNASEEKRDEIVKPSKDDERAARRDEARAERSAPRSRRLERQSEPRASAPERNEPRLFGTIVGSPERRPRRERIRTSEPSRDRVRAIFEGQP